MISTVPAVTIINSSICPRCLLRSPGRTREIKLQVRFQEHLHIYYCPLRDCGYEAKETSAAMRVAFQNAQKYEYLDPKRGTVRIRRKP